MPGADGGDPEGRPPLWIGPPKPVPDDELRKRCHRKRGCEKVGRAAGAAIQSSVLVAWLLVLQPGLVVHVSLYSQAGNRAPLFQPVLDAQPRHQAKISKI